MSVKRILVVDDEVELVKAIQIRLEQDGYETLAAYDGREGLEKARKEKPDLILLDIVLPDKNGYDLCYEIKHDEFTASIPVVLFTAKSEWKIKMDELCKFVKANGYISKPFESQDLLDKIKNLLEK